MSTKKAYKYFITGNTATTQKLHEVLDRARELYNASLQERRDAYDACVKRHPGYYDEQTRKCLTREHAISYVQQANQLPEIKDRIRPEYQEIASHVLQDVLRRVDKAYQRFFARVQSGQKAGFPRFAGCNRYCSFTYPDGAGWKLEQRSRPAGKKGMVRVHLKLSKIGTVKLHLHRDLVGTIKTLTIKREGEHFYAIFSCEMEPPEALPISREDVGIDLGITHFAALSTGDFLESPRHYRRAEKKLKQLQEAVSRKRRGSHRRKKAVQAVAKAHRKVRNQRQDFVHKASRQIVNRFQIIVLEDLKTANLVRRPSPQKEVETGAYLPNGAAAKTGLTKSIQDAGWRMFTELVRVKAEWAGRTFQFVDPNGTSQRCPTCGRVRKKTLEERWHSCSCGAAMDRDTAASLVILQRGYQTLWGRKGPA